MTKEFTVVSLHPGVTREQVQETCGWTVKFADSAGETPAPTELELKTLRDLQARTKAAHEGDRPKRKGGVTWPRPLSATTSARRSAASAARCPRSAPTISAPIPLKALMARNAGVDWEAVDDVDLRLRQPGRRGQPQCRAHGAAARRPAARQFRARRSTGCAARAWMR